MADAFLDALVEADNRKRVAEEKSKRPAAREGGLTGEQVAGGLIWLGAAYTTYLMVASLQPGTPWRISLIVGVVVQFVFTICERRVMRWPPSVFGAIVFLFDAAINAGGLFPMLRNVGQTPTAQMLAASGVAPTVAVAPALLLSFVVGAIIAIAPEALWRVKR